MDKYVIMAQTARGNWFTYNVEAPSAKAAVEKAEDAGAVTIDAVIRDPDDTVQPQRVPGGNSWGRWRNN